MAYTSDDVLKHHKDHTSNGVEDHVAEIIKSYPDWDLVEVNVFDIEPRTTIGDMVERYSALDSEAPALILRPTEGRFEYECLDGAHRLEVAKQKKEDYVNAFVPKTEATAVTAGMLDFPRKQLPKEIWLYEDSKPLPRLQPKLRAAILSEARYRLKKFGARIIGAMLYGGASGYQYHAGGDIDVSLYIDWDEFKGDEEILQEAFKTVEIPWEGYELHLFVKPSNQREQVEVADATYDVLHDDWVLPPLVLPRDFDPDVFFKPMIEMAEQKAQKFDVMMGEIGREWSKLKKALRALKEGARDEHVVRERAYVTQQVLLDKIDDLCREFVAIWKGRKKLHDQLRQRFINDRNIGRYERFQYPEVVWKYLDEMGYVEYLKVLAKAQEAGAIKNLLDSVVPEVEPEDEAIGD